jgi:hypothetical protein
MDDTEYLLEPAEVDSIVLGAAENTAQILGLTIAAPAKDFLLQKSLPALNKANEEGKLESRRQEIEKNTSALIHFIAIEQPTDEFAGPEITYQHLIAGLSAFCRRYPDFYPFCTS